MRKNSIQNEIHQLIKNYQANIISKNELIVCVRELFYTTIKERDLTIEAVKMLYIMTSIIDIDDLNDVPFSEEIRRLLEIMNRKCQCTHSFAIQLPNIEFNTKILENIVVKIKKQQVITNKEREEIMNFLSSKSNSLTKLSDLIIERVVMLINLYENQCTLFINNEEKYMDELCTSITNYIECLSGKRCVFVCVNYKNDGTEVLVSY